MRDATGDLAGAAVVAIDVTARRRAEEALAASEGRFRAVFDRAALEIARADTDGRVLESNLALQRLLGYGETELRGLRIGAFTHRDAVAPNLDRRAGRRDHYRLEKRYLHKAGHVVRGHLTVSAIPAASGQPRFGIATRPDEGAGGEGPGRPGVYRAGVSPAWATSAAPGAMAWHDGTAPAGVDRTLPPCYRAPNPVSVPGQLAVP